jgi:hypothetical protein
MLRTCDSTVIKGQDHLLRDRLIGTPFSHPGQPDLDRTTRSVIRYERPRTGEVIHLDIKKLAGIPDGGGKRVQPGWQEAKNARRTSRGGGCDYPHVAIDNHSRYAYAEALPDEKWITAADFLLRAALAFAQVGIAVERVITDNGGCYRLQASAPSTRTTAASVAGPRDTMAWVASQR